MVVTMDVFLCPRKCHLLLHVVVVLVLLSTKCLVQSRAHNHTVSLQKEDHVEADDELSGDDAETAEIAQVEVVGETRTTAPSEWATWGTKKKVEWFEKLDADKKPQFLNDLASNEYNKIVDEDIPKLKQRAERAKLMTPNTDITGRLAQLDSKLDGLRKVANEVKTGTYNKGTSGFKVVYIVEKGKPEPQVRIHQAINGKVDSLVRRSTPMREQHAERSLAVATAVRDNFKKIYDNWGVKGKELEVAKDMSLMLSGVMAAIPSPYTKGLAVILDLVSTVLGIVAPSAQDKVKGYIANAVDLISHRISMDNVIEMKGELASLKLLWQYVMVTRNNSKMNKAEWDNNMNSDLILKVKDEVKGTTKCQEWMKDQLDTGENPGTTKQMLDMYAEMVDLTDQVYSRIIHIMPVDDSDGTDDIQRQYITNQKTLLEKTVNWFKDNVIEFTRSSVGALYHLYPPAQSPNKRLLNFMREVTYERTDGKVMGVPYFPDPPKGTYYLESAAKKGHYVLLDRESITTVATRRRQHNPRGGDLSVSTAHKLGTTITIAKTKSTKIKIQYPSNANYYGVRSLTFEGREGRIKYLNKFDPSKKLRERYGHPSETYTKASRPIVAGKAAPHRGIKVEDRFRVIPLKKEPGMPGVPIIIGEPKDDSFWCLDTIELRIYMKPLNVDETTGAGAEQIKAVANAHIFYLIS